MELPSEVLADLGLPIKPGRLWRGAACPGTVWERHLRAGWSVGQYLWVTRQPHAA